MNHRHSADPLLCRSEHWGKVIDVDMLVHRPMNDLEIVSAHERDGELRPGCQLNWSRHSEFDNTQRPDEWRGGAQPESVRLTDFRASSRHSTKLAEPEPCYERSDTGHCDPPVTVFFSSVAYVS